MNNIIAICESMIQEFDPRLFDLADLPSALNEIISRLSAAEARAAQAEQATKDLHERTRKAEQERDQLQADFDAMKAAFEETTAHCLTALQERDETRRKLEQAQRKIDAYDKAYRYLNQALNEGDGVYRP